MTAPLIAWKWDGDAMIPLRRFAKAANAYFVVGEDYLLEEVNERSGPAHRHYFAAVRECWQNLPEGMEDRYPNPEALRKFALIKAGYRDERSIVCASKAEAARVAAFVRPLDGLAIVVVSEAVVTVYTAKSQSMKAMGGKVFAESKEAVLRVLAAMIEVTPEALKVAEAA